MQNYIEIAAHKYNSRETVHKYGPAKYKKKKRIKKH